MSLRHFAIFRMLAFIPCVGILETTHVLLLAPNRLFYPDAVAAAVATTNLSKAGRMRSTGCRHRSQRQLLTGFSGGSGTRMQGCESSWRSAGPAERLMAHVWKEAVRHSRIRGAGRIGFSGAVLVRSLRLRCTTVDSITVDVHSCSRCQLNSSPEHVVRSRFNETQVTAHKHSPYFVASRAPQSS